MELDPWSAATAVLEEGCDALRSPGSGLPCCEQAPSRWFDWRAVHVQDGYVTESRARNFGALHNHHYGLDLPIGGLGNPGPKCLKATTMIICLSPRRKVASKESQSRGVALW
eukprot:1448740-Amphidinium_carterae.2